MKSLLSTILVIVIASCLSHAQTHLYEHPDFDRIAKDHQEIALIPFKTTITLRPKQMKDISTEQLEAMEEKEARGLQDGMYSWFLKRKKRGKLSIKIQDPQRTNALLKEAGIDYSNIQDQVPEKLAGILEVDAVILGTYETNKPMSEGASAALGLLVGFWGSTNNAIINMKVHNSGDGEMLWNYNKKLSGSMGSSPEDLVNVLMRKASRRLAYTKSKNH